MRPSPAARLLMLAALAVAGWAVLLGLVAFLVSLA